MLRSRCFGGYGLGGILNVDSYTSLLLRFNRNLIDDSGHYTANMVGSPTYVRGVKGYALKTTHLKDYVSIQRNAFVDLINHGKYTVECCFKYTDITANHNMVFGLDNGTANSYYLLIYGTGGYKNIIFGNYDKNNIVVENIKMNPDTWYFLEVSKDQNTYRVFVDGVKLAEKSIYPTIPGVVDFTIAGRSSNQSNNDVIVDEFRLSNSVRHTSNYVSPLVK